MCNGIDQETIEKAWEMRKLGVYSMREIANKLNVDRTNLIDAVNQWLHEQWLVDNEENKTA